MPDPVAIPEVSPFGDINSLMELLKGIFGTAGNTSENQSSPEGLAATMALFQQLLPGLMSEDFSSAAAERDSKGGVDQIIRQMMEQGMPQIAGAENASGGYNSTAASLLKNDLTSRTAAEGAALV